VFIQFDEDKFNNFSKDLKDLITDHKIPWKQFDISQEVTKKQSESIKPTVASLYQIFKVVEHHLFWSFT
jgi:hypothetical protein